MTRLFLWGLSLLFIPTTNASVSSTSSCCDINTPLEATAENNLAQISNATNALVLTEAWELYGDLQAQSIADFLTLSSTFHLEESATNLWQRFLRARTAVINLKTALCNNPQGLSQEPEVAQTRNASQCRMLSQDILAINRLFADITRQARSAPAGAQRRTRMGELLGQKIRTLTESLSTIGNSAESLQRYRPDALERALKMVFLYGISNERQREAAWRQTSLRDRSFQDHLLVHSGYSYGGARRAERESGISHDCSSFVYQVLLESTLLEGGRAEVTRTPRAYTASDYFSLALSIDRNRERDLERNTLRNCFTLVDTSISAPLIAAGDILVTRTHMGIVQSFNPYDGSIGTIEATSVYGGITQQVRTFRNIRGIFQCASDSDTIHLGSRAYILRYSPSPTCVFQSTAQDAVD